MNTNDLMVISKSEYQSERQSLLAQIERAQMAIDNVATAERRKCADYLEGCIDHSPNLNDETKTVLREIAESFRVK